MLLIISIEKCKCHFCHVFFPQTLCYVGPLTLLCFMAKPAFRKIWITLFPFFKNLICCVASDNVSLRMKEKYWSSAELQIQLTWTKLWHKSISLTGLLKVEKDKLQKSNWLLRKHKEIVHIADVNKVYKKDRE